jgi:magnesium transporter
MENLSKKAGLPPGTPVFVGEKKTDVVRITIVDYDNDSLEAKDIEDVEECYSYKEKPSFTWINVTGLHDVSVVERVCTCFGLHTLVIEDILNTKQRPKMDIFDDHIFIVIKMHFYDAENMIIKSPQVSIVFGKNFVLTFQERPGDVFDPVRNRLKTAKGRIRKAGSDYLAYALMDAIVDNYFKVLESVGEEVESMEEAVILNPVPETLQSTHALKRETILLRKSVWPLREIVSRLEKEETSLVKKGTKIFIRDLYDHIIQVIDTVEAQREIIGGLQDLYLSSISHRMNEVMKVLTIFAAIFIPLTFIAGIYGMNFTPEKSPFNMPELSWYFGYPMAIGLMVVVGFGMLFYFKGKKWL